MLTDGTVEGGIPALTKLNGQDLLKGKISQFQSVSQIRISGVEWDAEAKTLTGVAHQQGISRPIQLAREASLPAPGPAKKMRVAPTAAFAPPCDLLPDTLPREELQEVHDALGEEKRCKEAADCNAKLDDWIAIIEQTRFVLQARAGEPLAQFKDMARQLARAIQDSIGDC